MRDHSLQSTLTGMGRMLYKFRTAILFSMYLLAAMAYAWRWIPY
ncbi:hypothetical protein SAMN04490243_1485 [Robiginitalea myxolifaciens]|uniref:Uncharacterized protein n=1 Tax=Robiginitalea myxolifaciens TaxID=400055 RepID=A0A1I6GAK1_9FLAO|nr:hypothetical protein [Robiginitalea myxolifaciens]SFR39151.1 hypothetical protein SAMN04490243_1485 [Robiginitalea myxolifaciens]